MYLNEHTYSPYVKRCAFRYTINPVYTKHSQPYMYRQKHWPVRLTIEDLQTSMACPIEFMDLQTSLACPIDH